MITAGSENEAVPLTGRFGRFVDSRGSWSRVFERQLFRRYNLEAYEASISFTEEAHTLRGLHSLTPSAEEWKLVTCARGEVWDVAVNVNRNSSKFGSYQGFFLSGVTGDWVLIPPGYAHGFISLSGDVILGYTMSVCYVPDLEVGYRFDDPFFNIEWPVSPKLVSQKDLSFELVSRP